MARNEWTGVPNTHEAYVALIAAVPGVLESLRKMMERSELPRVQCWAVSILHRIATVPAIAERLATTNFRLTLAEEVIKHPKNEKLQASACSRGRRRRRRVLPPLSLARRVGPVGVRFFFSCRFSASSPRRPAGVARKSLPSSHVTASPSSSHRQREQRGARQTPARPTPRAGSVACGGMGRSA